MSYLHRQPPNQQREPQMNAPLETQALFAKLSVGEASVVLGVELVPLLLGESDDQADAVLLEEGIASGQAQVNEVGPPERQSARR